MSAQRYLKKLNKRARIVGTQVIRVVVVELWALIRFWLREVLSSALLKTLQTQSPTPPFCQMVNRVFHLLIRVSAIRV